MGSICNDPANLDKPSWFFGRNKSIPGQTFNPLIGSKPALKTFSFHKGGSI